MIVKHLSSKLAITVYLLAFISLTTWAYFIYTDRKGQPTVPSRTQTFPNDSSQSINSTDDLINDQDSNNQADPSDPMNNAPDLSADPNNPMDSSLQQSPTTDTKTPPISSTPTIKGSRLTNITPEHCDNSCQAFAIDLKLFEYCEQACGISPVKNVTNCDSKKDIQKDYCTKDLAITKNDLTICDKIDDANIKQSCKNHLEQKAIEDLQRANPRTAPEF